MRIRHCVAVSFAGIVVGLVACGGNASSSCGSYFDSLISYETKCNGSSVTGDVSGLKSNFQTYCGALDKAPGANNFGGQLDTCVSLLNGASCGATINCKIAGTLSDGTACVAGLQCTGGDCNTSGATTVPNSEVTCGKCASYLAVGAQCGGTNTTSTCDPGTGSCVNGTCTAFAQQGQSCATAQCTGGLTCDTTKTCQPPPSKGQACTLTCQAPYKCISQTCADVVQEGGACPTGVECASNLTCDPQTKTCKKPTVAGAGQPCGIVQNQIVGCDTGFTCKQTNSQGTCVAVKEAGAACTVGQHECDEFLLCINGTCGVPDFSVCK